MVYHGRVSGGVVVLSDPHAIPEGASVKVEVVEMVSADNDVTKGWSDLMKLAGSVKDLPPDMAKNHDHYLHGRPKL